MEMDVVYIRSYPARPNDVDSSSATASDAANLRRSWRVSIRVNGHDPITTAITDPFQEVQYRTVLETYLKSSDRAKWSTHNLTETHTSSNGGGGGGGGRDDDVGRARIDEEASRAERVIREYGENLLAQIELGAGLFGVGVTEAQIFVVEHHDVDPTNATLGGIHCLAWELLEAVQPAHLPKLRLRVTRISDFPARRSLRPMLPAPVPLATVQADQSARFKVLLVVARDFTRTGTDRDPEPDLAQWPLVRLQKKLRSRMQLEVVRPGSREELEHHLQLRASQRVEFNLVHFDLHGRIMRDENGILVPWLLFAKPHDGSEYIMPETNLTKAEEVAELLARYQIENVVLNACLSAYNRTGPATNLAHIFLKHGIQNVSAMWYYVHWQTVATYLEAFYEQLLVKCIDFHVAAQRGREGIRRHPTTRTGREYHDFFLCVNYARNVHRTESMMREVSPSPSARSQESSTSNKSGRSPRLGGGWKPSTPRLGDSLYLGDEPVMRLQLHLLELEFKLTTFRVVYASDLRQGGSDLNATMERMINMWLLTNLVDEVHYYKAKDFAKRKLMGGVISPRERRTRATSGGYLQLLFPRSVRALRQTLHVVREVDAVMDPGWQADEGENIRLERRRFLAHEGLGRGNAQWWMQYLHHLEAEDRRNPPSAAPPDRSPTDPAMGSSDATANGRDSDHVLRPRARKPVHSQLSNLSRTGRSTPVPENAPPSTKSLSSARKHARAEQRRRIFPTIEFASRVSHFDPESDYRDFHGFFNLFWIGLAIMGITTMLRNFKDTGYPLRIEIWSLFTVKLWHLAIADFLMVAGTAVSLPLHRWARASAPGSAWTWKNGGMAVQSIYQVAWLALWIVIPFWLEWTWTAQVFLLLHTMVLLMKMHSYAFYNGHLSETEKRLRALDNPASGADRGPAYQYPAAVLRKGSISGIPTSMNPATGKATPGEQTPPEDEDSHSADELETLREDLARELTSPMGNVTYPRNLTWSNYFDYLLCPTLCYELEYPRTKSINWTSLNAKIVATFGCIFLLTITSEEFIVPVLADASRRLDASISWLLFPFMLTFLLVFLVIFEYVLGAFAEITHFADRHFYADWWNSTDWMEFSREWNAGAMVITFLISAVGHEIVMACITKKIRGYGFVCQMLQLPIVMLQRTNMIMGLSMICALYVLV
ncbi:sterol o-acyltransferase (APE2) [Purpureocillium lavendulum]|uniref:Sterol o-acyltransferase (APE2) n=1 Tax=Purpureocillium lavendulum TaxID=1247861 RepID=A0AB34FRJ2_9HYPO|nr:sterol o-acyltransferase (APE2) [Purpureocillium lavendulum]